jgi:hypothetical protein
MHHCEVRRGSEEAPEWDWGEEEPEAETRGKAYRGMDDIEQGLVTINVDLSIGQSSHDSLQTPGVLFQEIHGQDGCR